jgi:hypothetical protein
MLTVGRTPGIVAGIAALAALGGLKVWETVRRAH